MHISHYLTIPIVCVCTAVALCGLHIREVKTRLPESGFIHYGRSAIEANCFSPPTGDVKCMTVCHSKVVQEMTYT